MPWSVSLPWMRSLMNCVGCCDCVCMLRTAYRASVFIVWRLRRILWLDRSTHWAKGVNLILHWDSHFCLRIGQIFKNRSECFSLDISYTGIFLIRLVWTNMVNSFTTELGRQAFSTQNVNIYRCSLQQIVVAWLGRVACCQNRWKVPNLVLIKAWNEQSPIKEAVPT